MQVGPCRHLTNAVTQHYVADNVGYPQTAIGVWGHVENI